MNLCFVGIMQQSKEIKQFLDSNLELIQKYTAIKTQNAYSEYMMELLFQSVFLEMPNRIKQTIPLNEFIKYCLENQSKIMEDSKIT